MNRLPSPLCPAFIAATLVALLGSGGGCNVTTIDGIALREVRLTPDRPFSRTYGLRLDRVDPDGTAVVRSGDSVVRLTPGDPPERLMRAVHSDPAGGSAVLEVWWGESRRTCHLGPLACSVPDTAPTPVDVLWSPLLGIAWLLRGGPAG